MLIEPSIIRGPRDHINIRISHSNSKALNKGDTRNHGLEDPYVHGGLSGALCNQSSKGDAEIMRMFKDQPEQELGMGREGEKKTTPHPITIITLKTVL